MLGNVKMALNATYHGIKHSKYGARYLAEFAYRFNRRFDLRGTFDDSGQVRADSQFLAEAVCADIPQYGSQIPATGMCDTQGVITAAGPLPGSAAAGLSATIAGSVQRVIAPVKMPAATSADSTSESTPLRW